MSAYTARSLYEDKEEEEGEGVVDLPPSHHEVGEIFNDSPTHTIIMAIYGIGDTLQVAHIEKQKIQPASSCVLKCLQKAVHPLAEYNMHIHFPGLMGLISPRTQQSSGYGFKVQSGESYHVSLLTKKDPKVLFVYI